MKKHLRILKYLSENKNVSKRFEPGHKRGQIHPLELLVAIISFSSDKKKISETRLIYSMCATFDS